jgi:pimeloyl-ACP methyl ester carboxylesterase
MRRSARPAGAVRVREWAFPAPPVQREVLRREPREPREPVNDAGGGGRPPLLFLHGLAHCAWCWAESWLPAAAEQGWSAHAVSLRAHGSSGGRERRRRVRLSEYEHDLMQEAARLPRPPVVVAHSFGCVVAARVAARYPFAAIVLLSPVGVTQGVDVVARTTMRAPLQVARIAAGLPIQLTRDDLFHGLDEAAASRHIARLDPEPPLVQLQILLRRPPAAPVGGPPVLVYGAGKDALVPAGGVERTARFYGVSPRWLPGMGHDVMLDTGNEAVLDRVLNDLTDELSRR